MTEWLPDEADDSVDPAEPLSTSDPELTTLEESDQSWPADDE